MAQERLQKILARGGIASRRAAEEIIRAGRVRVNGRVVTELGTKADPYNDKVELDGKRVVAEEAVYVICHKPRGVVSTLSDPEGRPTIATILSSFGARLFPVGRLDFATSGALLATNDGDFSDGLLHPKRAVPKTYVVKVHGIMEKEQLDKWRRGVQLEDGLTQPAEANFLRHEGDKTWFELTIKEGRNQQIRRMGEATGFPVMRLSRTAFAGITTEGLTPGGVRPLTREELGTLKKSYGVPKKMPSALDLAKAQDEAEAPKRPAARPRPRAESGAPRPGGAAPEHARGAAPQRGERGERGARGERGERRQPAWVPHREARSVPRDGVAGESRGRSERRSGPPSRGPSPSAGPRPTERAARGQQSERGWGADRDPRSTPPRERARDERPAPPREGGRRAERSTGGGGNDRARGRDERREPARAPDRARAGGRTPERPPTRRPSREGEEATRSGAPRSAPRDSQGARSAPKDKPRGAPPTHRGTDGARYGGGSPVRRGYEVTSDWGGGSGRGRVPDDRRDSRPPREDRGGRGDSSSRTTGTGGGPKAPPGQYDRVKGRRGK